MARSAPRTKLTRAERKSNRKAQFGVRAKKDAAERIIVNPPPTVAAAHRYHALYRSVEDLVVRQKSIVHARFVDADTANALEKFTRLLAHDAWLSTVPTLIILRVLRVDAALVGFCRHHAIPIYLGGEAPAHSEARFVAWCPSWDAAFFPCHNAATCTRLVSASRFYVCPQCRISVFCSDACLRDAYASHAERCREMQQADISPHDTDLLRRLPQSVYSQ